MAHPLPSPDPSRMPWGVLLALAGALGLGAHACRAGESERCICAEDCRYDASSDDPEDKLVCVAGGRVLSPGQCTPAVGEDASPGVCVREDEAGGGDGGDGFPEVFMDLGSKRDFDPGPPPDADTETGTTDATGGSGSTTAATSGTTDATSSSGGTTDASSSGGTTGASSGTGTSSSTGGT